VRSPVTNLIIRPDVVVEQATCENGKVTISGSGFGGYLDAEGSGTALSDTTTLKRCTVETWSDTRIVADCSSVQEGSLRVDSVFGSTIASAACSSEAGSGRPKWWAIWSWWSSWSWSRR